MPVYEFICQECGKPSEVRASIEEYSKGLRPVCPHCGSPRLIRAFSAIGLATRGPGSGGSCCGPNAGGGCCGG